MTTPIRRLDAIVNTVIDVDVLNATADNYGNLPLPLTVVGSQHVIRTIIDTPDQGVLTVNYYDIRVGTLGEVALFPADPPILEIPDTPPDVIPDPPTTTGSIRNLFKITVGGVTFAARVT